MTKYTFHSFLAGIALLLLSACGPEGTSFRIKGSFRDMQAGELYIYNLSDDYARLDTLTIQEGKFLYRGEADEVTSYMLVFPNGMEQVIFAGPGYDLTYEATANDLKNYVVNGSEENQLMNQFRQETYTQNPTEMKVTARRYIKDNLLSPVAIHLFEHYFVEDENVSDDEVADLLKVLKAKHPHNRYVLDIDSKVKSTLKRRVGETLPDVSLVGQKKTTIPLWSKQKKFNLITFWSIWMPNGYDFLWKLRRCADKYDTDGQLRIVAVSLDMDMRRWEDAVRPDAVKTIEHYCDGEAFESAAIKKMGIHNIPYFILTNQEHKILDCSDDVSQMEEMLKKKKK